MLSLTLITVCFVVAIQFARLAVKATPLIVDNPNEADRYNMTQAEFKARALERVFWGFLALAELVALWPILNR